MFKMMKKHIKGGDMVKNRNAGFTLIELFITMAMIGIMAAIAVPSFMNWLSNYRLKAASHDIRSLLQTAKVKAIKENSNIVILFKIDNNTYKAFVDNRQGSDPWSQDNGEKTIKEGKMPEGINLYEASFDNVGAQTLFNSRGFPRYRNQRLMGHVYMRNDQNKIAKVFLSAAGNIRIE